MCSMTLTLADTSGAVEAVVHGGLPGPGGRRLPDCVAACGPPQEVSSAKDYWNYKISHFQENHDFWNRVIRE